MKKLLLIILLLPVNLSLLGQHILRGGIDVWNRGGTTISLMDDFFYQLSPGDVLNIRISGSANIAPRDEQRKGGGFLGLFKKSYNVRIDNWRDAGDMKIIVAVGTFGAVTLTPDAANPKELIGSFTVPKNAQDLKGDLLTQYKISAYINEYMTPIRAGQYNIEINVDSKPRLVMLREYFNSPLVQGMPILNFEEDIRPFMENGKVIYKHPDDAVKAVTEELANKPNIDAIKKDLYKYLLNFAPNNTTVRAELSKVYLEELNFNEAQTQAKRTIQLLSKKANLTASDQIDYGRAYEVLAGVNELREMGLQENAYSVGAVFYGEAAGWYTKASAKDAVARATLNQVRCLQKVGTLHSLLQAASILETFNTANPTN